MRVDRTLGVLEQFLQMMLLSRGHERTCFYESVKALVRDLDRHNRLHLGRNAAITARIQSLLTHCRHVAEAAADREERTAHFGSAREAIRHLRLTLCSEEDPTEPADHSTVHWTS